MSSVCNSSMPARPTFINLYKWPESDAEFVKSMTEGRRGKSTAVTDQSQSHSKWSPSPPVVDSFSCRQMYLRSYPFSKEEKAATGKTKQCFEKAKEKATSLFSTKKKKKNELRFVSDRKLIKDFPYSSLFSIFYRFLFCTTSVEVVDRRRIGLRTENKGKVGMLCEIASGGHASMRDKHSIGLGAVLKRRAVAVTDEPCLSSPMAARHWWSTLREQLAEPARNWRGKS
ncbi:hypothetical protein ZIOFF_009531 [Zingiber officinale]|uniref:Uncharacterized protein n=1 Tax=Zingiber officinale TaxID=94328 RepID=A0A8J5HL32_ZINOF|nr:hypothetical protein ZIOFF_009531 [Zingiber officinale]